MRKVRYFLSLIFVIFSCTVNKEPIFIKVDAIKIISYDADMVTLKAVAFFENPNDVGGKISADSLNIFVNNIAVAEVFLENFKVPAKNEFSIPLTANIPTKKLLNTNKNGLLGGLLNSLITNKVNVRIKGNLDYVVFGFKKEFLIDKTEVIKINF
ncbi:hypothetical protein K8354_08070 [Polaribacter litorisediminis]|uniref:hypothetical protein n=1 Tax=Polaribacter litorisediminis TaxID=1908341 RepID=UPI001CBE472B|nr:hypothetical protein [Polaribacter litorisediminis]UAM99746.1 hypothetical protein K8354_08070 [Polaribacter litorisediminis]